MNYETIKVYDWNEVQAELCKRMGIEEKYFRNYHDLVGGQYKDFWHLWCELDTRLRNDTITQFYFPEVGEDETVEDACWCPDEYAPWGFVLLKALVELGNEFYEKEGVDHIHIRYSW